MTKVLIWLASGDAGKLLPGLVWGYNAKSRGWVDEVKVIVFGESEKAVADNEELFSMVLALEDAMFCRYVAEKEGNVEALEKRGANVDYVGEHIASAIKDGYTVLTF